MRIYYCSFRTHIFGLLISYICQWGLEFCFFVVGLFLTLITVRLPYVRGPLFPKTVTGYELFFAISYSKPALVHKLSVILAAFEYKPQ